MPITRTKRRNMGVISPVQTIFIFLRPTDTSAYVLILFQPLVTTVPSGMAVHHRATTDLVCPLIRFPLMHRGSSTVF